MPRKMNKNDVASLFDTVFNTELQKLRKSGQAEYAHEDDRPFRNFEDTGARLGLSREITLLVYANKHMDGIVAHFAKGVLNQRDDIRGRINDLILYMMLLRAMVEESEGEAWQ